MGRLVPRLAPHGPVDVPHVLVTRLYYDRSPFGLTKVPDHRGVTGQRVG